MSAENDWASQVVAALRDLRRREGWSSSAFARTVLAVYRSGGKTTAQQQHLDRFMPGWRTDADELTLETLRVAVGALGVLGKASSAGYDVNTDPTAEPLLRALAEYADDLAPQHRVALTALVPLEDAPAPSGTPNQPLRERLVVAKAKSADSPARQPKPPRPGRRFMQPAPTGRHSLAGQWVRASNDLVTIDVFVVTVDEAAAAVVAWTPTTGRTRKLPLAAWSLTIIDDPRV